MKARRSAGTRPIAALASAPIAFALLFGLPVPGTAQTPCPDYGMDVEQEFELFHSSPTSVHAAPTANAADELLESGRLYQVRLLPQGNVPPPTSPAARQARDLSLFGGVLVLAITDPGRYRIAIDSNAWIDVANEEASFEAVDFRSDRTCKGPQKIVTFNLPSSERLILRVVDARTAVMRLSATRVQAEVW